MYLINHNGDVMVSVADGIEWKTIKLGAYVSPLSTHH